MNAQDVQLEELREKSERRRRQAAEEKQQIKPLAVVEVSAADLESAVCLRCGERFSYEALRLDGKSIVRRSTCDECAELTARENDEREQRQVEEAAAEITKSRLAEMPTLLRKIGVNCREHGAATFQNFDVDESGIEPVRAAQDFLAATRDAGDFDPVQGLYLHGETGNGKTHLAVAVLRELLVDPKTAATDVIFDPAAELIARIQDTYATKESTFAVLARRFRTRLWVLDDLGTERASEDVARHLSLIFARRALAPTIVTSNLSPARLEHERPELFRVLSRLGPRYFRAIEVRGRDRRFD